MQIKCVILCNCCQWSYIYINILNKKWKFFLLYSFQFHLCTPPMLCLLSHAGGSLIVYGSVSSQMPISVGSRRRLWKLETIWICFHLKEQYLFLLFCSLGKSIWWEKGETQSHGLNNRAKKNGISPVSTRKRVLVLLKILMQVIW